MPIKPENVDRYPLDWPEIRERILARARHRCEWPGCGAPNGAVGFWLADRFVVVARSRDLLDPRLAMGLESRGHKLIRLVLTIAHLDHTPENCAPENLSAWCQRHHLRYDLDHHRTTAYMTRHARAETLELFAEPTGEPG